MSKRDDIMKLWLESFRDPREYVAMYFERVYRDDEALVLAPDGESGTLPSAAVGKQPAIACSLLLQHYSMSFQGSLQPVSYVAGASTRRQLRGQGYMSRLMKMALEESASRGDMLCTLIPAGEGLYYYYARFGFATVFYTREQRFTSLHSFPARGELRQLDDVAPDDLWQAFDTFQRSRECYVLHTRRDFDNILADLEADGGSMAVMGTDDPDRGTLIASMAWGVPGGSHAEPLLVKDAMGTDENACTAALGALHRRYPGVPVLRLAPPDSPNGGRLMPRGMARVVDAGALLGAVAKAHRDWKCVIRLRDPLLPQRNSHTWLCKEGRATIIDGDDEARRPDLDTDISVLADIAFSAPHVGTVMGFPSQRPMISLMLD